MTSEPPSSMASNCKHVNDNVLDGKSKSGWINRANASLLKQRIQSKNTMPAYNNLNLRGQNQ